MEIEAIDHDYLFKELFTQFFFEFVEFACPEAMPYIDTNYLEFLQQELYDELFPANKHIVDIAAKCRFKEKDAYFLIHGENQAQPVMSMVERIFDYFSLLLRKLKLPVFPIAVFSYDKPFRKEPDTYNIDFPWGRVLDFHVKIVQLNRMDWREYLGKPSPITCALLSKMKIARKDRPKVKAECLRMLITLKLDTKKTRFLSAFIDSYLKLNKTEAVTFQAEIEESFPKEIKEKTLELTNNWIETGKLEGRQIGAHEQGEKMLLLMLNSKFGAMPPAIQKRVQLLDTHGIEKMSVALLEFNTISETESWMNEHLPTAQ